jgi:hypothetical protein
MEICRERERERERMKKKERQVGKWKVKNNE